MRHDVHVLIKHPHPQLECHDYVMMGMCEGSKQQGYSTVLCICIYLPMLRVLCDSEHESTLYSTTGTLRCCSCAIVHVSWGHTLVCVKSCLFCTTLAMNTITHTIYTWARNRHKSNCKNHRKSHDLTHIQTHTQHKSHRATFARKIPVKTPNAHRKPRQASRLWPRLQSQEARIAMTTTRGVMSRIRICAGSARCMTYTL